MVKSKTADGPARKAETKKAPGATAGTTHAKADGRSKKPATGMPSKNASRGALAAGAAATSGSPDDPKRVIATVAFQADGGIAWVDYTDGPYLTEPLVDFSAGEEIVFTDPQWDVKSLVNLSAYALLRLRKTDGSMFFCVIKPPRWW